MASDLRLQIFRGDPVMRLLRKNDSEGRIFLVLPPLAILTLAAAAAQVDLFSQEHLRGLWCRDLQSYLLASEHLCKSTAESAQMSFLRDLATLLAIILISFRPWLMYRQWSAINLFLDNMETRGLLAFPHGRTAILTEVRSCNRLFTRVSYYTPYVFLAAVLCIVLVLQATRTGTMYPILSRNGLPIESDNWWVFHDASFGWVFYILWGSLYVYTVLMQNIYGGRTTVLAWRARDNIRFSADPDSVDGRNGWSEIRQVLRCTWGALLIDGSCLALVGLSLPADRAWLISPLLIQWLIAVPAYIGIPLYVMRTNIIRWRKRELDKLEQASIATTDLQLKQLYGESSQKVRKLTVNPYAGVWTGIVTALATIGTFGLVFQIIRLLYLR
jgi:hypothetical protein